MNIKNAKIPLSVFSSQRAVLMGIATAAIIFVHSPLAEDVIFHWRIMPTLIWNAGYNLLFGCVDLFLLLSGMGLFFSYEKDPHIGSFYKKRFLRILPEVYLVAAIWLLVFGDTVTFSQFKDDMLFLRFFRYDDEFHGFYWFFTLLLFLYLIYPLIHNLYQKCGIYGFLGSFILVTGFTLAGEKYLFPGVYGRFEIALTRIPAFLIGAWLGRAIREKRGVPKWWLFAGAIVSAIIWVCAYKKIIGSLNTCVYRYAAAFFCIYFAFLIALLFSRYRLGFFRICFSWLGIYSMEVYLIYEKVVNRCLNWVAFQDETGLAITGICILITLGLSVLLKLVNDTFQSKIAAISQSVKNDGPEPQ